MSDVAFSHANARLSYRLGGTHVARLRCTEITTSYGVNAQESHAKRFRAFYPHQRVQGVFALKFDFIHYAEFSRGMAWFRDYIEDVISQKNPSYMQVQVDDRQFLRLGYPTTGMAFGDHVGSMVFSPTIMFISVADPRDSKAGIKSLNSAASRTVLPAGNQVSTNWFYPDSKLNNPGKLASYLYDQTIASAATEAARVQDLVDPDHGTGPGRKAI